MHIQQSESYVADDWWNWSVWIEGAPEELDGVSRVEWQLHPTFPNPIRVITDRTTNFRLDTAGWGVFPIHAAIHFSDGRMEKLRHYLELHYPDGGRATA